jgi:hypothetical protein
MHTALPSGSFASGTSCDMSADIQITEVARIALWLVQAVGIEPLLFPGTGIDERASLSNTGRWVSSV